MGSLDTLIRLERVLGTLVITKEDTPTKMLLAAAVDMRGVGKRTKKRMVQVSSNVVMGIPARRSLRLILVGGALGECAHACSVH